MGLCQSDERQSLKPRSTYHQEDPKKYSTVVLNHHLVTIVEENTVSDFRALSQLEQVSKEPSTNASLNGKEIKSQQILRLLNPSRSASLHSHVVKFCGMNEVSACPGNCRSHDDWELIGNRTEAIRNGNIIQLRHHVTNCMLRGVIQRDKKFVAGCSPQDPNQNMDDAFWIIEMNGDFLTESLYIKFKHVDSKLYLTRAQSSGTQYEHRLVTLSKFNASNSLWVAELTQGC